jgi:hypothetical protein
MAVVITGNNTPTAGGVTYGDGSTYANTAAGSAGGVLYSAGASAPAFSAAGTSGQVLKSNGASAPSWVTPSSGALTLLSTIIASNASTVDIETTFNSTYDTYMIVASGVTFNSADAVACRMKIAGSYLTSNTYYWHTNVSKSDSTSYAAVIGQGSNTIRMSDYGTGSAPTVSNFVIMVYVPASATLYKTITWQGISNRADRAETASGVARNDYAEVLTGIRLYGFNGSSLISGNFRLYGIANS